MENGVLDMPGQAFDFEDVTSILENAAVELEANEVILTEEFSLQEAMSALEIGEPRLDTGAITWRKHEGQPTFNPLRPLLPEEVCWILDQAMAYEMEFHGGNVLAHTVYTLLYVHHLDDISPEYVMKWHPSFQYDHRRPLALITVVLRTAVQALLKCVDLSWRELAKGGMYDAEDWQSDKYEVNVLEVVPDSLIVKRLDSAVRFVSESPYISKNWKSALISRLLLRQSILQLLGIDIIKHRNEFMQTILRAHDHLRAIKSTPLPTPAQFSAAALAFDPYVGRTLQMATPIRVVTPPSLEDACMAVERFLDGLFETSMLTSSDHLTTWQAMTDLHLWLPNSHVRMPYVRSLAQSTFYDGTLILKKYAVGWIVSKFFYESCGKDYDFLRAAIIEKWKGEDPTQIVGTLERTVQRVVTSHVQALFNNPPRRRRYFMKHLTEWHRLYEILVEIKEHIDLDILPQCDILAYLPDIVLLWRFSVIREIVLSGFQLELYRGEEIPFAYWYSAKIIDEHLKSLDNISSTVSQGSEVHGEMRFQFNFLTLLHSLCTSLFLATISMVSLDLEHPNFTRRYKWAFEQKYATSFELCPVAQPDMQQYRRECDEILGHIDDHESVHDHSEGGSSTIEEIFQYPAECVELAKSIGEEMQGKRDHGAWAGVWAKERAELIRQLCVICTDLSSLPKTSQEMRDFDARKRLKWEPVYNPWFPRLLP